MSQYELASKFNVSQTTMSRIENGTQTDISIDMLLKISDAFEIDMKSLVDPIAFSRIVAKQLAADIGSQIFLASDQKKFNQILSQQTGLIIVTGAAGSGKTTLVKKIIRESLNQDRSAVVFDKYCEFEDLNVQENVCRIVDSSQIQNSLSENWPTLQDAKGKVIFLGGIRTLEDFRLLFGLAANNLVITEMFCSVSPESVLTRALDMVPRGDKEGILIVRGFQKHLNSIVLAKGVNQKNHCKEVACEILQGKSLQREINGMDRKFFKEFLK
jgi:Tfp pilus assembly pilus retraction ATPase PilT/DNA-binding Xre family transcriptional regulator